ncbi:MAG: protein kinase [Planctomycetaceae bacterium]|nr:protein kinase [Planctomycetaceae bacterium]
MKTSQCDQKRIDDFFQSERLDCDIELARHLEVCRECRGYFDSQAAQPSIWLEAQKMLRPTEFDLAGSAEFAGGGQDVRPVQVTPSIETVLDSLGPSDDPSRLGRLGTYEVSGVIGAGGMGVVLKAVDPSLDRVVAIKVLAPHLANNGTARKRFSREAKAAAAVLHPNVIPIHSVSSDATSPYLVMAYIRGGSLQKRVDREGPLSTIEILRIGSQVAAGLAAAHEQGLIHRDIKPENILLEEGVERVTLTDFGLARAVDDSSVTREGTIAGTPQYMSPEQARGESVDQRSDLFSLGSVLYTLCTERPPFSADSTYGVMRKISDEQPTPILELNPDIPIWLICIIEKLMAKKQAHRFHTASDVHDLLETCLQHVQQPNIASLPAWLSKKAKPRFRRAFAAPASRPLGFTLMLTMTIAAVLGLYFLAPGTQESPVQTNQPEIEATGEDEVLGHGYKRKGEFIYFDGKRIDQAGKEDLDQFAKFTELELKLAEQVDAASFKALSEEYTKDKNKAYYKWISPGRFWVVELSQADVSSFEVLGFNIAKDSKNVWWYGQRLPEVDPSTVSLVNEGFVWKDASSVWYQHEKVLGADAETFRHLEQAFYSDKNRVYWSSNPLPEADPDTFRTFGDDSPYGADRTNAWKGSTKLTGIDGATFEAVHQSVYKDKNGVFANGYPVFDADPKTFRKVADLDESFTALLADQDHSYVFLPFRGEVYRVKSASDSLQVKRQIWAPGTPQHRGTEVGPVAIATAELGVEGWRNQSVVVDGGADTSQMTKDQEAFLLDIYKERFAKAWRILRVERNLETTVAAKGSESKLASGNSPRGDWRTDIAAFDTYLSQLADAGKVPDKSAVPSALRLSQGNPRSSPRSFR